MTELTASVFSQYSEGPYGAENPFDIVRQYPFATLISPALHVTATPIIFESEADDRILVGHMARRNPHAAFLEDGQTALAVFNGPHAYISPSWYEERRTVPTWNYISARVRGTISPVDEADAQLAILNRTIELMEADFSSPWTLEQAPEGKVESLLPLIRSFRIRIDSIEGTTKLSQTHPEGDRSRVAAGLRDIPGLSDSHAIAKFIEGLSL